jgi:peptidoglycan/LPS O-acetylase OafA/YrhL
MQFEKSETFLDKHKERIIGLDIIRCVAILSVVYAHGKLLLPGKLYSSYESFTILKIDGVSIFFILSGFLVGRILIKMILDTSFIKKDLTNFWIRRWLRTIPTYLLVLSGLLTYRMLIFNDFSDFDIRYFFFAQNFLSVHPDFFPEAWSLSFEEWFYLLLPLFCFMNYKLFNNKNLSILISISIFLILPLINRVIIYEYNNGQINLSSEYRKIVFLNIDSLIYGFITAYLSVKQYDFWIKYKKYLLYVGMIALVFNYFNPGNWKNFYPPLTLNIESLTIMCFFPFLSNYKTTNIKLLDTFFIFISLISYSMYLLNLSIIQGYTIPIMNNILDRKDYNVESVYISNYIAYWMFTIVSSFLLYNFYERPITNLRDRIKVNS